MNDGPAAIITAIASLVGSILWPAIALAVILLFRRPLSRFIDNLQEVTVTSPSGLEASMIARVEASVVAATVSKTDATGPDDVETVLKEAHSTAAWLSNSPGLVGKNALWVDDQPSNNRYEQAALSALGLQIVESTSTKDALEQAAMHDFDLIISDMGRPDDRLAGLALLNTLRRSGNNVPYVIYTGLRESGAAAEAKLRGATGYTDRPSELVQIAIEALSHRRLITN